MPKVDRAQFAMTATLAVCALVITALVIRREFFPPDPNAPTVQEDWRELGSTGLSFGPPNAPVQLLVFTDFQCPYCRRLAKSIATIRAEFRDSVRVVLRHYPITESHPEAFDLAKGAECAFQLGRFERYHDLAFELQDSLAIIGPLGLAVRSGVLDTTAFRSCTEDPRTASKITSDVALGDRIGLAGTPLVMVNELRLVGTPTLPGLRSRIEAQLDR